MRIRTVVREKVKGKSERKGMREVEKKGGKVKSEKGN